MKKLIVAISTVAVMSMLAFAISDLMGVDLVNNRIANFGSMVICALTGVYVSKLVD